MVLRLHKEDICAIETKASYVLLTDISKTFGSITAIHELTLGIKKGEFFSLLGPSGCGKTTILRLIAGLERPDSGDIIIGERVVAGSQWVQPEKRRIGLVFQDYALFPHMTVFKNIAFGLTECSKNDLKEKVMEMLDMVGLSNMANRYPHELSGGQQQRVALARALAPSPEVMLLDEPFSNLDADLRMELRTETKRILKESGTTTILVTHDQEEAFSLSDRVGVLNNGRLEQVGTPEEIYHRPLTRFVANFVGRADFVYGRIEGDAVISGIGVFQLLKSNLTKPHKTPSPSSPPVKGGEPLQPSPLAGEGEGEGVLFMNSLVTEEMPQVLQDVEIMIRPDDVDFVIDPEGNASIIEAEFLGAEIIYKLSLPDGKVIHSIRPSTRIFTVGSRVSISIDPAHIVVFGKDKQTEIQ